MSVVEVLGRMGGVATRAALIAATSRIHHHRTDLGPDDGADGITTPERTLVDCMRSGPFSDALCVADSALRDGFGRILQAAVAERTERRCRCGGAA